MIVVFDTNIFCTDFRFNGYKFKCFFDWLDRMANTERLMIPKIVLDETINKYREHIEEYNKNILKTKSNLETRLGISYYDNKEILLDEEKCIDDYTSFMTDICEMYGIEIIEYPNIKTEDIAKKAMLGKKPFKEKGQGFRDVLVWESVVNVVRLGKDLKEIFSGWDNKIVFITSNVKDFCLKDEEGYFLHSDLISDLKAYNMEYELEFYVSIDQFIEKYIRFDLSNADVVTSIVSNVLFPFENLYELLLEEIEKLIYKDKYFPENFKFAGCGNLMETTELQIKVSV